MSNQRIINKKERRQKRKIEAIDYKGGKCSICGYDKCKEALDFHHINPDEKEFSISDKRDFKIEKIKLELDKCILLCRNCHAELHYLNE